MRPNSPGNCSGRREAFRIICCIKNSRSEAAGSAETRARATALFMEYKVDALVLRTADYGESDKMLTLFSLQQGKISAAAKGVRKAGAKLRFAAQPFCFAEYVLP